ncbi:MAG: PAS domain S-box protein [Deltaproteobacteria bacterium]|nr:PAS domain S-box protein [Deltaproteobacteria bacterium]
MTAPPSISINDHEKIAEELKLKDFAIASSIYAIGIANLNGTITYVNDAAMRMWGTVDPKEMIGENLLDFARSKEDADSILAAVINSGKWEGEVAGFRKDGTSIIALLSANLVYNNKNEPVCVMTSLIDITDRKKTEEDLRLKDFAIASSVYAIGIADLDAKITYVNKAAIELWGAQNESELIGKNALEIAVSESQAREVLCAIIENGKWEGEIIGRRKDGRPITTILSANLVYDDDNVPVCIMASLLDISDRKKMEQELRIKDFAVSSSINAMVIGDLAGNITYVNDAFLYLWGDDNKNDLIGKPATSFARDQALAATVLSGIIEKGKWSGEIEGVRKDGRILTVQLSANLVTNGQGEPICLLASFVDITDRKTAEIKLAKANHELEDRVAERTQDLVAANEQLVAEIEERKEVESSLRIKEEELKIKTENLQETNTALKILLRQREEDRKEMEEKVLANVKGLVIPYLEKLKSICGNKTQATYINIMETNLHEIISPYLKKLSAHYNNFTPLQIQVADLVKAGKSTKEISEVLNISDRAVEFHRNNIRAKLGIKNRKVNLQTYLLSLA